MGACFSCLCRHRGQKQATERSDRGEQDQLLSLAVGEHGEHVELLAAVPEVGDHDESVNTETLTDQLSESGLEARPTQPDTKDEVDANAQCVSSVLIEITEEGGPEELIPPALQGLDSTLDFPFLTDEVTISHIKSSKTIFIMRGLSGSGKSTIVDLICRVYPEAVVCSADDYFRKDGEYRFAADQLQYAHDECQQKAKAACEEGRNVIVIDNTNVKRWEMKYYNDLTWLNYTAVLVEPRTGWSKDPVQLALRTQHGISEDLARKKLKEYENVTPFYYAWFLNAHDSQFLLESRANWWKDCLINLPEMKQMILSHLHSLAPEAMDIDTENLDMLEDYYRLQTPKHLRDSLLDRMSEAERNILHCTAKYCGSKRDPAIGAERYNERDDVKRLLGKVFDLEVTGLTFTPRTFAARIHLSPQQLGLFDKPEEAQRDELIISQMAAGKTGSYPERGRCAHLTLGCATDVAPKQTNLDLLDICDIEYQALQQHISVKQVHVMGGTLRYYREGIATLNFEKPLNFRSVFSGHY